jgi:hypothetical protein
MLIYYIKLFLSYLFRARSWYFSGGGLILHASLLHTTGCATVAVPAYRNAEIPFSQARLWEIDGTVFRPTPCQRGHGIPCAVGCLYALAVSFLGRGSSSLIFFYYIIPPPRTWPPLGLFPQCPPALTVEPQ